MKYILSLFLLCLSQHTYCKQHEHRFLIRKDNLWGYIDNKGSIIIEPKYHSAGEFSEGLAPVRINATYGYIDINGNTVIPPQFDMAYPFSNGYAKVYIDAKPFLIDRAGRIAFQHDFKDLSEFSDNSYAIIFTESNKYGFVNKTGVLVIDTVFSNLGPVAENGTRVVYGLNHDPYNEQQNDRKYEVAIIDRYGNFVLPYNVYREIDDYRNGYFRFKGNTLDPENGMDSTLVGFIDTIGHVQFEKYYGRDSWITSMPNCGLITTFLTRHWLQEGDSSGYVDKVHYGYTDLEGNLTINDTNISWARDFNSGRAFVATGKYNSGYVLINTLGKQVTNDTFVSVLTDTFQNGLVFAKKRYSDGWSLIDTNGSIVLKTNFGDIDWSGLVGEYFFYKEFRYRDDENDELIGIARKDGTIVKRAIITDFDRSGFKYGLLKCIIKQKLSYINEYGKIVWKEKRPSTTMRLNLDCMNRGYFYAASKHNINLDSFGGWGVSDNMSLATGKESTKPGEFQLYIDTSERTKWQERYAGFKLYAMNTTHDTIFFDAQDSRLYLNLQAQDKNGTWKDIEYLPNSWCGNSYHSLYLAPNEMWQFTIPEYHGGVKTKIRAKLLYKKSETQEDDYELYSNEINGFINPGQFWNKRPYYPTGIMDPYLD